MTACSFIRQMLFVFLLLAFNIRVSSVSADENESSVKLTSLPPVFFTQIVGVPQFEPASDGKSLQIGDRKFDFGISAAGPSEVTYILNGQYNRFDTWVGVEAGTTHNRTNHVIFQVFGDGNKLFDSGPMSAGIRPKQVGLDVSGINELQLSVFNEGVASGDGADWAQPKLTRNQSDQTDQPGKSIYAIQGGGLILKLDANGEIAGLEIGASGHELPLTGGTRLAQCKQAGLTHVQKLPDGGIVVDRMVEDQSGNKVSVTDRFTPTTNSVRWDVDIFGHGKPWSTAIITGLKWHESRATRFWTAWSDPDLSEHGGRNRPIRNLLWHDPLETRPFTDSSRWYGGNPISGVPITGDFISIPIMTVIEPDAGTGFSIVQSPEDTLLYMKLITTADGRMEFQHRDHRLGGNHRVHFAMDLVSHEADWRSGLAWMVKRYPDYFQPWVANAYEIEGCGAYSTWEGELNAGKLAKMAFAFNWKASYDFPYMGMFLPPAENWRTFGATVLKGRSVSDRVASTHTSAKQLNDYSQRMRRDGFYVLNYFNATEFGAQVKGPANVNWGAPEKDPWTNCTDFLYRTIADGLLCDDQGGRYTSWHGAVVMDCGAKNYQKFLLEQAQSQIDLLPDSSGICIDRMDWLRFFNPRADDGVSWHENKPVRSLYVSWNDLMGRLGPMMHRNGKVIFMNPLVSTRIDLLHYGDGIYSEHNESGPDLNATALLGICRPVVAWTRIEDLSAIGPDTFFQRLLYLGVFPTDPFPGNDHCIVPSDSADKWFLEYGPLLNELKGRKWVLAPDIIQVVGGHAKANIFEVPDGYVIPVVLADKGVERVTVELRSRDNFSLKGDYKIQELLPGIDTALNIRAIWVGDDLQLQVPLHRGCAMIHLVRPG